jgi:hypothetical protein
MPGEQPVVPLATDDLRAVVAYAATCAEAVLGTFERAHPDDPRPRAAIAAAWAFARGGRRGRELRDTAWAALRAARAASGPAAQQAARAASAAAGAAYLHPLPDARQVAHILGAAAHAARAVEMENGDDPVSGADAILRCAARAPGEVIDVLRRYPSAPSGGGRVGQITRDLDLALRARD